MNEWGFAAEVKSWWDAEFLAHPEWGLARCEVERKQEGSSHRSDLVVYSGANVVLAGELRLPDHPLASPWHPDSLEDAIRKASGLNSRWAFTSDGTELLLIDVDRRGRPQEKVVHRIELEPFKNRAELDFAGNLARVQLAWTQKLFELASILAGLAQPGGLPVDLVFIESLRALLSAPVAAIREGLDSLRKNDRQFEARLIRWMVEDQNWIHEPSKWPDELLRTARLAAYVFTTRLMFYEALRRSHSTLRKLRLHEDVPALVAAAMFKAYFEEARDTSRDYETLFEWDEASKFALCANDSVPGWRRVLDHLSVFDLSQLPYDVVGGIFTRLIDPHERYQWGQHYTSPDVVDLMVSFAIPDGGGKVLDPAAGAGTFLVRAYERKRVLMPAQSHQERLGELFGIDISAFASTLAAVNLATRSLDFAENYPQVAAKSFFSVTPSGTLLTLPSPGAARLGTERRAVNIEPVRAVICNPPYVRRKNLEPDTLAEATRILSRRDTRISVPGRLHGLSNYHVYFWLWAAQFIEPGGRLAFITAGEWLDSDYGIALQAWLLDHFIIECVIESLAETWFSEARVGTVVVVARHCSDAEARRTNMVRFVTLRKPLRHFYGQEEDAASHFRRVDQLRERVLGLTEGHGEGDEFDWSVLPQSQLEELGEGEPVEAPEPADSEP